LPFFGRATLRGMLYRLAALGIGVQLLLGCATSVNPATGRREVLILSEADERQIDAEAAQQVEFEYGLVRDPELTAYIEDLGQQLAAHSPRKNVLYSFQIVEMDEPNAFALPGGHIYVSRGLLVVANSEAEVANVLGHEIGHVAARHAARQDAHMRTLGLSTLLSDMMSGGGEEPRESEPISGNFLARYARNQEREADRIGQDIVVEAGIDPVGMAEFLETLDNLTKLEHGFSPPQTYFATHPATPERIAETRTSAQERVWRAQMASPGKGAAAAFMTHGTREEYLNRIEGMSVGRPAAEGVFVDDRFLHADLGFSLRFPAGWEHQNQTAQVVSTAPRGEGVVILQLQGPGADPERAAREFARREGLELHTATPIKIGGLPAFRAEAFVPTSLGRIDAEITWIGFDGNIYRLIASAGAGAMRKFRGIYRRFAHSFRPLTPEDREAITELRLRTVRARPGESLAALSARSGNEWSETYTGVVNRLVLGEPLAPGTRVKVAVREPYASPEEEVSLRDSDSAAESAP
jgi:predicted Zn-dependent protease